MKKAIVVSTLLTVVACTGCGNKVPKEWYKDSIAYFESGIRMGWDKVDPDDYGVMEPMQASAYVTGPDGKSTSGVTVTIGPEEYWDSSNRFGYLLKDLDGDGAEELLIGLIDDAPQTRFLDLCVWNSDFGATHVMSCGDGDYMYLCNDGTLIRESTFGGTTETEAMKYSSENNSFAIVGNSGITVAGKFELTPF